jgi:hypothetical protein
MSGQSLTQSGSSEAFDRRNTDWYIDKLVQVLVFIGGISAIIFVVGIFVFITKEGLGFILDRFDFMEFFTSPYWYPADEDAPEYGIRWSPSPSHWARPSSLQNSPPARPARPSRYWWNYSLPSPLSCGVSLASVS